MSLSSPTPPAPYGNPASNTAAQLGYNVNAAAAGQAASNVNQETPFGSLSYNQTGTGPNGIPLYTATSKLNPQIQAIVDSLRSGVGNQVNTGNYAGTNASDAVGNATTGLTANLMQHETNYLQPFFSTQQEQLDNQLRNQGLFPGQPGYDVAMRNLGTTQSGSVENFLANIEPQAFQQSATSYSLPLTVAEQELGLINPNYGTSSFINPPQTKVAAPDYNSAVNSYNSMLENQYSQQVAQQGNMMSGLFGIPTAVLGGWARSPAGGAALTGLMGL